MSKGRVVDLINELEKMFEQLEEYAKGVIMDHELSQGGI